MKKYLTLKNNFHYNNMTRMLMNPPDRIAYFSDFSEWNEHEDEMVKMLLEKAKQLNVKPVLVIGVNGDKTDGIYNHENINLLAKKASDDLFVCYYVMNEMTMMGGTEVITNSLKNDIGVKYVLVANNYQDPVNSLFNTKYFADNWQENTIMSGNYATKPTNDTLRNLISNSDFDLLKDNYDIDFMLSERVLEGKKKGRLIGFPTINLEVSKGSPLKYGIYAVNVFVTHEEKQYIGVACYWMNELKQNIIEIYILDFDQDIYGWHVTISFIQKLRDNKKVESIEELKDLIKKDVENAKEIV